MSSITLLSLVLPFVISITCASLCENKPIILVMHGAIEQESFLPISIFWYHPNFTPGDVLVFYSMYPQKMYLGSFGIESYTGSYEFLHAALEHGEDTDQYCAEIIDGNGTSFTSSSCYPKIEWMYDRKDLLENVSLMDLIIPGTHQSAAYANSSTQSLDDQSIISRWILCQRKSIKSQLMDGIRYLDLRPGFLYVEGKKKYIVTHGVFDLISMDEVVKQINEFMHLSRDVVIVSFGEFLKGFNSDDDHLDFINYLERSFEEHARPMQSWNFKLREIFDDSDKRLILSYSHNTYKTSPIMWSSIPQYWSDAQTINRLHSYFDMVHQKVTATTNDKKAYRPYAAMMEFTHSVGTVVQDTFTKDLSLRHWAERISRYILQWYIEEWSSTASIIAVDFYQTSGIVDLAIQLNERKFGKSRSNHSA